MKIFPQPDIYNDSLARIIVFFLVILFDKTVHNFHRHLNSLLVFMWKLRYNYI